MPTRKADLEEPSQRWSCSQTNTHTYHNCSFGNPFKTLAYGFGFQLSEPVETTNRQLARLPNLVQADRRALSVWFVYTLRQSKNGINKPN